MIDYANKRNRLATSAERQFIHERTWRTNVTNLSKTAKKYRAAIASTECRGEPYSQGIPHAEQSLSSDFWISMQLAMTVRRRRASQGGAIV